MTRARNVYQNSTVASLAPLLVVLIAGFVCCDVLLGQQSALETQTGRLTTEFDTAVQLESFDQVWSTIKRSHWDSELVGDSWDAARDRLRPAIEASTSMDEVREILNELLESLGQSHFGIIPNEAYKILEDREKSGGEGFSGLGVHLVDGKLTVTSVRDDSPALSAGVQTGWLVQRVGEKTSEDILDRAAKQSEHSPARKETVAALTVDGLTTGSVGEVIEIEFLDRDDATRVIELELVKGPGRAAKLGHLPTFNVEYRSEQLSGNVGYVAFNAFLDAPRLIEEYMKSLDRFRDQSGLIIDLRGNRGGLVILVSGMCGWFVEERKALGSMVMRGMPLEISLNPRNPRYERPVAVLIDECSISAAEIMSGGLKDLGLARVFGTQSAGLVLPSVVTKLPNGDGFQYAMADYHSASGEVLEGVGVTPDVAISPSRADLFENPDPVLERALHWIQQAKEKD